MPTTMPTTGAAKQRSASRARSDAKMVPINLVAARQALKKYETSDQCSADEPQIEITLQVTAGQRLRCWVKIVDDEWTSEELVPQQSAKGIGRDLPATCQLAAHQAIVRRAKALDEAKARARAEALKKLTIKEQDLLGIR